jgi:hypothetical protein
MKLPDWIQRIVRRDPVKPITPSRSARENFLEFLKKPTPEGFQGLYTRKKSGGNLTPRKVPMTGKLREVLSRRYQNRDAKKPWVFWRVYKNPKTGKKWVGPFNYRREILMSLCDKAQVRYFSYHAIRHAGASLMDRNNAPIGAIQKILGHENRRTTEIYLHSIDEAEAEAIAIYEAARQKSHTSHTQKASSANEKGANQDG